MLSELHLLLHMALPCPASSDRAPIVSFTPEGVNRPTTHHVSRALAPSLEKPSLITIHNVWFRNLHVALRNISTKGQDIATPATGPAAIYFPSG
jgi:hypothetical protein